MCGVSDESELMTRVESLRDLARVHPDPMWQTHLVDTADYIEALEGLVATYESGRGGRKVGLAGRIVRACVGVPT